ncbi:DUF2971 domain-containing protein [Flavobacterium caeni]|uniref:DUF2971 domain-containing protein n=1 Tax=Flavobacterium caeni TaxID=490189 RepID=A0A1G5KMD5_9FLAO|nr:DUF2971 domain-containing protein [Flavobacterium caeni]SCZ01494.1 Protein of unknown function [Flavobacterium caeni]
MTKIATLNLKIPLENYNFHYKFQLSNTKNCILDISENHHISKSEELYKFYSFNSNNIDALQNSYFYLTSPREFNDPFDCQNNQEELIQKKYPIRKEIFDNLGVSCFTRNIQNPSMWNRYADDYSGYCIKFKNNHLIDQSEIDIRSNVAYTKEYYSIEYYYQNIFKEIDRQSIDESSKNDMKFIITIGHKYCQKSIEWKNEEEYRIVSLRCKENYRKIKYDKLMIEAIYLGHNMSEESRNHIVDELKSLNIKPMLFIVNPSSIYRKLNFESCNGY